MFLERYMREQTNRVKYKIAEYYYVAKENQKQKDDSEYLTDFQLFIANHVPKAFRHNLAVYGDPAASWDAMLTNKGFNYRHADNSV